MSDTDTHIVEVDDPEADNATHLHVGSDLDAMRWGRLKEELAKLPELQKRAKEPKDQLVTRETEIERLQEQVAVLRDALNIIANTPVATWDDGDLWARGMNAGREYCAVIAKDALHDTAPAAEAYRQRVRREALEEVAEIAWDYHTAAEVEHAIRNLMEEGPDNG